MSAQPKPPNLSLTTPSAPLAAEAASPRVPTVGIGASAGGLEAFGQLLAHLPAETGMAFVLIQHLDPKHESRLVDLLARNTRMPLVEAAQDLAVAPDHVYVIPPNTTLTIAGGVLQLVPREGSPHLPIDAFFESLARDGQAGAVGVLLSGGGSDGTLGLEEIKAAGGITLAQDEDSARYASMPQSAMRSGCVDFVLPPEGIARELARIGRHPYLSAPLVAGAAEAAGDDAARPAAAPEAAEAAEALEEAQFQAILALLRSSFGVDFGAYREAMIRRRIRRRLVLGTRESLDDYVRHLESDGEEREALYQDFLINVTRFFREPATFEALKEKVFPEICKGRAAGMPIRIWAPGCSTGQEAYSLAMVLLEYLADRQATFPIQIFATDLSDTRSLRQARAGVYPESIEADVSQERLRRFFTKEEGRYRISKAIRDMCVFARQDVAADPPFSRMDLISCRNLLIYLAPPLQKRVLSTFHYALNPHGFLLLGSAESVASLSDLFEQVDHQHRIFAKKATAVRPYPLFHAEKYTRAASGAGASPLQPASSADWQRESDRIVLGQYAPAGVLVDDNLEVVHFRGQTGQYLAPAPGEASFNVLRMAREGLFLELRSALAECREKDAAACRRGVRVRDDGQVREVDLRVLPIHLPRAGERCFLILFEDARLLDGASQEGAEAADSISAASGAAVAAASGAAGAAAPGAPPPARAGTAEALLAASELEIVRLRQELVSTGDYLQSVIEDQEAANEDLKSANEEVLSSNEELQSTNEELQTAKEELQSVNEELTTVNEQLQYSNVELGRLNDDFTNLLGSASVPIVAVGIDQRIRRFTPAAEKLLSLLPVDVGRPIGSLKPHLDVPELESLIAEVIDTAQVQEREVCDRRGCWWTLRVHPYRTADRRIDGAVVVLIDIDEIKGAQVRLQKARDYARAIVETIREPLLVLDAELRVQSANPAFHEAFQVEPGKADGRLLCELGNGQWDIPVLGQLLDEVLSRNTTLQDFEVSHHFEVLGPRTMLLNARAIQSGQREAGEPPLILLAIRDVSDRKRLEDELRDSSNQLAETSRRKDEFLATLAHELRNPLSPILNSLQLLEHFDREEAPAAEAREVVRRQVRHMVRLIDDLLDISRITGGRIRLSRERVDLAEAIAHAAEAVRPALEAAGYTLRIHPSPAPLVLDADPVRLVQIVENLLSNAVKYGGQGGGIDLSMGRRDGEAVLRVRDRGIGIAPEMLPRVWELFMQVDPTHERSQGGLGIGLTLVRDLVELHGGGVEVESAGLGRGSEFIVRLPLAPRVDSGDNGDGAGPGASAGAGAPAPESSEPAELPLPALSRGRRILVLDDNPDQAGSLSQLLTLWGHEVRTVHDGPAALEEAAAFQPEVVFLDIGLPGMDGHEVARRLRRDLGLGQALLIALTGFGTHEDRRQSEEAGIDTHIVKPVEPDALRDLIAAAVTA